MVIRLRLAQREDQEKATYHKGCCAGHERLRLREHVEKWHQHLHTRDLAAGKLLAMMQPARTCETSFSSSPSRVGSVLMVNREESSTNRRVQQKLAEHVAPAAVRRNIIKLRCDTIQLRARCSRQMEDA
jgi:hypothetical protein